jgi:hypothetical protein
MCDFLQCKLQSHLNLQYNLAVTALYPKQVKVAQCVSGEDNMWGITTAPYLVTCCCTKSN